MGLEFDSTAASLAPHPQQYCRCYWSPTRTAAVQPTAIHLHTGGCVNVHSCDWHHVLWACTTWPKPAQMPSTTDSLHHMVVCYLRETAGRPSCRKTSCAVLEPHVVRPCNTTARAHHAALYLSSYLNATSTAPTATANKACPIATPFPCKLLRFPSN
jgi:hypothetical protein